MLPSHTISCERIQMHTNRCEYIQSRADTYVYLCQTPGVVLAQRVVMAQHWRSVHSYECIRMLHGAACRRGAASFWRSVSSWRSADERSNVRRPAVRPRCASTLVHCREPVLTLCCSVRGQSARLCSIALTPLTAAEVCIVVAGLLRVQLCTDAAATR